MSDDIDPSDELAPPARPPRLSSRTILARAHRWARDQGLKVIASANPGVVCVSTAKAEWEVDPSAPGVGPLGAAILMRQHEVILSPKLDRAEFLAVGESINWVTGFCAGIAGIDPDPSWEHHPAGERFNNGWMLGRDYYNAANIAAARRAAPELVTCRHHPHVRYESDSGCPRCAREMEEDTVPDCRSEAERAEASDPNNVLTPITKAAESSSNGVHRA